MASKSSDVRPKITLACVECKERNYITKKNRRNDPDRIELDEVLPALPHAHRAPRDPLTSAGPPTPSATTRRRAPPGVRRPSPSRAIGSTHASRPRPGGPDLPADRAPRGHRGRVRAFAAATGTSYAGRPGAGDLPDRGRPSRR